MAFPNVPPEMPEYYDRLRAMQPKSGRVALTPVGVKGKGDLAEDKYGLRSRYGPISNDVSLTRHSK